MYIAVVGWLLAFLNFIGWWMGLINIVGRSYTKAGKRKKIALKQISLHNVSWDLEYGQAFFKLQKTS